MMTSFASIISNNLNMVKVFSVYNDNFSPTYYLLKVWMGSLRLAKDNKSKKQQITAK